MDWIDKELKDMLKLPITSEKESHNTQQTHLEVY